MIQDYIRQLTQSVDKRTEDDITALIAADGNGRHEYIRGRIQALSEVKRLISEVEKDYLTEDQKPAKPLNVTRIPGPFSGRTRYSGGRA